MKHVAILLVSCSKAEMVECWSADGSRWLLRVGSNRASINFRCWTLPGFEIGMTMDDFQINRIRQDVTESLNSAMRYSIPLDPR